MAVDPTELLLVLLGLIGCVLGSLVATIAAVAVLLQLRVPVLAFLPNAFVPTIIAMLNETGEMTAWFASFNLVPLPPLTGMHLLTAIRPTLAPLLARYQVYAGLALAALALTGVVRTVLQPVKSVVIALWPGL